MGDMGKGKVGMWEYRDVGMCSWKIIVIQVESTEGDGLLGGVG